MGLLSIVNELVVDEVEKSVEFYQKIFSFSVELTDGNPISWAQLKKDNMEIILEEYKTVKEEIKGFPKKTRTNNLLKFKYDNLDELKAHYERGGLGDVKIKKFLVDVLERLLEPIREKRSYYEARIDEVYNILKQGSIYASEVANQTLHEVKDAMKINYFDDQELIQKHIEKYKA